MIPDRVLVIAEHVGQFRFFCRENSKSYRVVKHAWSLDVVQGIHGDDGWALVVLGIPRSRNGYSLMKWAERLPCFSRFMVDRRCAAKWLRLLPVIQAC